jgi:VWFA-related protein
MTALILMLASLLILEPSEVIPQKKPVFVSASFLGQNRLFIEDMRREELRILENGKPREIEFFAGVEVPTVYAILFDRAILPEPFDFPRSDPNRIPISTAATNVAYQVIDQVLSRQVGWVGTYDQELRVALDFTQDMGRIKDMVQSLRSARTMEDSSLYSAFFNAIKKMNSRNEKRRILILFLEALDMNSGDKLRPMKNLLSASNVELFVASFAASKFSTGRGLPPLQSEACLKELAGVTAGGAFFTMAEGIEGIGRRISNQIRTLYTIGFELEASAEEPSALKIQCTRPGVKIAAHPIVPNLQ